MMKDAKMTKAKKTALWRDFASFNEDALMFNGLPVPLGGMTVQTFLKEYWHKKPLLIRNALPEFKAFFTPDDAMNALQDENIETRVIAQNDGWQVTHGPLTKSKLPKRKQKAWTALVQGADLIDAHGHALLQLFRFIPDARLDDLMISFATDGGGVGPHYDSYDVFLLQAHGQRHWSIGQESDLSIVPDVPVKILQNFTASEEFVLNPGDMLYLPPQYAHDGVAVGDCMTYSIGFRAPTYRELGVALLNFVEDNVDIEGRYSDAGLKYQTTPAHLSDVMVNDVYQKLQTLKWDKSWVAECLGCYLTEPKASVWFECEKPLTLAAFKKQALANGVVLTAGTRMLYHAPWVFINGEHLIADGADAKFLASLADARTSDLAYMNDARWQLLHDWHGQGWLNVT
jgi:50S ribosomal protein L16 3-hydroxylase